jgi:hypothetical protein
MASAAHLHTTTTTTAVIPAIVTPTTLNTWVFTVRKDRYFLCECYSSVPCGVQGIKFIEQFFLLSISLWFFNYPITQTSLTFWEFAVPNFASVFAESLFLIHYSVVSIHCTGITFSVIHAWLPMPGGTVVSVLGVYLEICLYKVGGEEAY